MKKLNKNFQEYQHFSSSYKTALSLYIFLKYNYCNPASKDFKAKSCYTDYW